MTRGYDATLNATRFEPDVTLLEGKPYTPSWAHKPRTSVVPYLAGHRGLVGAWRDHMARNVPETDETGYEVDAAGTFLG